jgi:hypothetical protein
LCHIHDNTFCIIMFLLKHHDDTKEKTKPCYWDYFKKTF